MSANLPSPSISALSEAEALLREGLRRITNAQTDLPNAQDPISEALRLSEEQALTTIAAVERGQDALRSILQTDRQFIDKPLGVIEESFAEILASQQAQDLAGQRLKKALTLLQAVETRIAAVLHELSMLSDLDTSGTPSESGGSAAPRVPTLDQSDVDSLLAELGI